MDINLSKRKPSNLGKIKIYLSLSMRNIFITIFTLSLWSMCLVSCTSVSSGGNKNKKRLPFVPISGIDFYETRRAFANGLSFDTTGFQQEPIWHINFTHDDSVYIYSVEEDKMLHYAIYHDQDSIFYFGREWFRVIDLAQDSLLLQRLAVQNLKVKEARSNVYMKFYSERFIRDSLKSTVEELRKSTAQDTAFVQEMVNRTNNNPLNSDSLFAARNPVELTSINANLKVQKHALNEGEGISRTAAYQYLYPEFDIQITNAYKDFYHSFSIFVDENGKMTVARFVTSPEFEESRRKVLQGIIDVYFKNYMKVVPGSTLGIPHNTLIMLYVKGTE